MIEEIQIPKGRIPRETKAWLKVYPQYWGLAVCRCGKWYHEMDRLAPHHTEMNFCKDCGYEGFRNE